MASGGDQVIRFSCVAINLVRTGEFEKKSKKKKCSLFSFCSFLPHLFLLSPSDGILSTGVSIDSAIVGMTAMVYVNGSAFVCCLFFQFFFLDFFIDFIS